MANSNAVAHSLHCVVLAKPTLYFEAWLKKSVAGRTLKWASCYRSDSTLSLLVFGCSMCFVLYANPTTATHCCCMQCIAPFDIRVLCQACVCAFIGHLYVLLTYICFPACSASAFVFSLCALVR